MPTDPSKYRNVPVTPDVHRRLKMEAAYQQTSIYELASRVLDAGLNALMMPNIHNVARDSDPIGED